MRRELWGEEPKEQIITIIIQLMSVTNERAPVGWGLPEVKHAHIELVAWLWLEVVPENTTISEKIAWMLWGQFRENPESADPGVATMRQLVRQFWGNYVALN